MDVATPANGSREDSEAAGAADRGGPAPGQEHGSSTHFLFEKKVFQVKGARFRLPQDGSGPVLNIPLGDCTAALRLPTVRGEFGIDPDSPDGKLLDIVEQSLRYVKEIRPGDSIPRELLDGTASWSVEERHRVLARGRLSVQLASWVSGKEAVIVDEIALRKLIADPQTKALAEKAIPQLAEKLGLGAERSQEVLDHVDNLGRELAYIEALRDRYGAVRVIVAKINHFAKLYRSDRAMVHDLSRIQSLLVRPIAEFDNTFDQVDAMTGEILSVLRKFDAQVQFVRETRDDLHTRLMGWDPMIAKWHGLDTSRGSHAEAAIKDLYRFAARHFPQRQDWGASQW